MDAEQLKALVQIVSSAGALGVLVAWIRSLQEDIRYWRQQTEDAQEKLEKTQQNIIEWQRYERMKDLPRESTRPLPPPWQSELRERVDRQDEI